MERFFDALRPLIRAVVRRPLAVVLLGLALSAAGLLAASDLRIDTDLANLLPEDYASVQALERLRETVGSETPVDVGIESPSFEANLAFAEALIPEALALRAGDEPLFSRAEFRKDTTFLAFNALYFASGEELDQLEAFLETEAEDARLAANPFFVDLDDDLGLEDEEDTEGLEASLGNLQVQEYPVSPDSTVLAVRLFPTGAQSNIGGIRTTYRRLDSLVAALGPAGFQPEMEVTTAGRLLRQQIEIDAITDDVRGSFGLGAGAVLLFVVLYFFYKALQVRGVRRETILSELARLPVTALMIGLPLVMSLAWTFGVAGVAFGTLNLMTSTLALVLFGLGIDYGIHFYARYAEERGAGCTVEDAAETTFVSTGLAVAVSALTTSVALFALTIADFRGFSEFGLIGGVGILFALVAMLVVLPALLALAERWGLLRLDPRLDVDSGEAVFASDPRPFPAVKPVLAASAVAVVLSVLALPQERFEYNFSSLEPEYRAYYDRADRIRPALGGSGGRRNPAYLVLDDTADVQPVVDELRRRAEEDTLILAVESLQERFPTTPAASRAKLARLDGIRDLTNDPFLRQDTTGQIARVRRAASTTEPIPLGDVPVDLKRTFTSKSGEVGTFVIVYPAVPLSRDARLSMAFADEVGTVEVGGTTYHAGSTSIVAAEMLRLMLAESPLMIGLTFVLIGLLMLLVFRSLKWTLLALLPLVVGILWMLGMTVLTGVSLTFYNLVVLPAVLGIGNDCGVHLVHRYREEGRGSLRDVLRSTGEHVTMGALTTMIGFSGLLFSFHPGLRSIGLLAVIGIGTTLLAALFFLPALLQWLEDRHAAGPQPHA
ncbi:MAG: MMPL family transporter [Bacteroidota bacterium]